MGFSKKNKPLLKCEVIHSIPGRVRIGCRALKYLKEQEYDILKNLNNIEYIRSVKVETITANVLVHYYMDLASVEDILDIVESVICTYSINAYQGERKGANTSKVQERRLQEESTKDIMKRIALTSAGLVGSKIIGNQQIFSKIGFMARFTTLPSIISLILSKPIIESGTKSLIATKRPNADTLTMASVVIALVTGRGFSALTTILLSDIAELMTVYTMSKTRNAIKDMLHVGEKNVWKRNEDGTLVNVTVSGLEKGHVILHQTGDKISIDGVIIEGSAVIDQSAITGEFMPQVKREKNSVFAGTIVKSGSIFIRADKVGDDTAVSRIVHMVEDAANNKAQIQMYADKFSAQLIPLNFLLAALVYSTTKDIERALNMLIIDYSCGVRLSTATALSAAIHTAARNGVLLKGGNIIESMANADTIILDKTGTMTEGKPRLVSIIANGKVSQRKVVEIAAAAEETSSHPLAHAVMSKVKKSAWKIPDHTETIVHISRGVETTVDGKVVRVGNIKFMVENNIDVSSLERETNHLIDRGENVIFVSYSGEILGVLGVHDTLRENMKKSINRLRYLGFDDVKLLTGDLSSQARIVANSMAMDGYESELLPEDKARYVLNLQSKGSKVIMVGDGINDAPALAYADVGIAIGNTRTDVAIEAADVTINSENPMLIPSTAVISKKTMSIVKQNFGATVAVNTIGLLLGATGFLPVFWGAVLHNFTTILVVMNSGRLLFYDFEGRGD